jgi:hypothetical protein
MTIRVQAPATWSPIALASRIKRELARAIYAACPAIKTRVPSIFTRAQYLRTCGTPHADGAMTFLSRERGAHS